MKNILLPALILGLVSVTSCGTVRRAAPSVPSMETEIDSLSYSFGVTEVGMMVKAVDSVYNMNEELIIQAVRDVLAGHPRISAEEGEAFAREYFTVRLPAKNLREAEAFLAEIESRPGVQKSASGLLYEIGEAGGERPTEDTDTVVVRYTGMLADGTVFDSTADRDDEPVEFQLNRVIPGWTEGLKLVGKGGRIKLYIPPALGYGEGGQGQMIQPNQVLIFEIELLDIKPF